MPHNLFKSVFLAGACLFAGFAFSQADSFPVTINVDAKKTLGEVDPVWRFFGADEPNYATMKDGRTTLATLGSLAPDKVYFRAHNLLTTGDGTPALKWGSTNAYTEDANGNPVYDWTIVDRIFDTYRERGVKPYVEIGFMPEALSVKPQPYQHDFRPGSGNIRTGWAYPPKDYARWEELVYQWVRHCVDRYGREEVANWYWQTWNEPNLPQYYWGGTQEEFFKLHDHSIRAVRRALPEARVGGPDIAGAGDKYMTAFIQHVKKNKTPTDFLSFHAKGSPTTIKQEDGRSFVRMGLDVHLRAANNEFSQIAQDPDMKTKPVIIGESDPEGCAACQGPANAYRNGTLYSSYTAASFARLQEMAKRYGIYLEGILSWSFEFEDQPYFAGFRQLTSAGIDLPVMNSFKMFSKMKGQLLQAESSGQLSLDEIMAKGVREQADVGVTASMDNNSVYLLVWHYHDDDLDGPDAAVQLIVDNLPAKFSRNAQLTHYRVDKENSNSYTTWLKMGSPIAPSNEQRTALLRAAELASIENRKIKINKNSTKLDFRLPRQGISLVVIKSN
ncbi:MAG: beta-xylosidase [Cellvibrio sp.]|nr:beta-xylosidase [Cellvibrio sp.]